MGNSEVGHTNIGAGRVVWMDLPRIDNAIADGSFAANAELGRFVAALKASGGTAHVAGLGEPGRGACPPAAHRGGGGGAGGGRGAGGGARLPRRPRRAAEERRGAGRRAGGGAAGGARGSRRSRGGSTRWTATSAGSGWRWRSAAILDGEGPRAASAAEAIAAAYAGGETDEFVTPTVIGDYAGARDGDGLYFANFRADRARQILGALVDPGFDGFDVARRPAWAAVLGMVEYSDALDRLMPAMFPSAGHRQHPRRLGRRARAEAVPHRRDREVSARHLLPERRRRGAGGRARRATMAPSPKVRTYDLAPEMSAAEVTEHLVAAIRSGDYALLVVNYANPDMVGHTGILAAAIEAVEAVDAGLGEVLTAVEDMGGAIIVTADHGNCEVMVDPETGGPHTAHTLNPVPVILVGGPAGARLRDGRLADLAPTLLAADGAAAAAGDDRREPDRRHDPARRPRRLPRARRAGLRRGRRSGGGGGGGLGGGRRGRGGAGGGARRRGRPGGAARGGDRGLRGGAGGLEVGDRRRRRRASGRCRSGWRRGATRWRGCSRRCRR